MTRSKVLVFVLVLCLVVLGAVPAIAGRGAGRGGGNKAPTATLVANPNPAQAGGAQFEASGCGYMADRQVNVVITRPMAIDFFPVMPDSDGCIAFTWWTSEAGTYEIDANQQVRGKKQTTVGTTTLTVYEG